MKLNEISRRGFLGAVGAAAVAPTDVVKGAIQTFTKELGGAKNMEILAKLLSIFDIVDLERFHQYASGECSFPEVLTDDEADDLADKLISLSIVDKNDLDPDDTDSYSIIHQWATDMDFDGDISEAASEIIGREIQYLKALGIIEGAGIDRYDFFDYHEGVGQRIKDAYSDFLKNYKSSVTADNIVQTAQDAGLPTKWVRAASMISGLIKKIVKNTPTIPEPLTSPSSVENPAEIPKLPTPSDNDLGLSHIDRMKDLAGIKRQ